MEARFQQNVCYNRQQFHGTAVKTRKHCVPTNTHRQKRTSEHNPPPVQFVRDIKLGFAIRTRRLEGLIGAPFLIQANVQIQ